MTPSKSSAPKSRASAVSFGSFIKGVFKETEQIFENILVLIVIVSLG